MRRTLLSCLSVAVFPALALGETPDPTRYEREVLVPAAHDPLQLDVAADGRVFFIERRGAIKCWDPSTRTTAEVGHVATRALADSGALALALSPDFLKNGHVFVVFWPEKEDAVMRLTRFTFRDGRLDPASEARVLDVPLEGGDQPYHCGSGLAFDSAGNLLWGMGDNSPPQEVPAIHPTERKRDSRRTAGNSMDLRGKILRLRPKPEGGYDIPAGNLYPDAAVGRPEIYVMGTRNPFRLSWDAPTGWLVWGDVGGNVETALDLGPEGCDELNLAKAAGNFGWPFFSGDNAPWRPFDPATRRPAGDFFDPAQPVNDSPHNTGAKKLPPPQPALLWYGTAPSAKWPQLGSGGRSITGGPVYRWNEALVSDVKLPAALDGCVIFAEWMRNFLALARLKADGTLAGVEKWLPEMPVRKPSDLKIGPDGALYLAEYGDAWTDNRTGQITRIVYRRGNRAPVAEVASRGTSGGLPLEASFDATASRDADGDALSWRWDFGGGKTATGPKATHVFTEAGRWPVTLTVADAHGATATRVVTVDAGNAPPKVAFSEPRNGSFIEWGRPVAWKVAATDAEDGALPAAQVQVTSERRDRAAAGDEAAQFPGLALMRAGTCFACHRTAEKSAGPPYAEVARRHAGDAAAAEKLAQKVISGGAGAWGEVPMPPHPQHTLAETRQMVAWILSLAQRRTAVLPFAGGDALEGTAVAEPPSREWGTFANGVLALTATATDRGAAGLPPLTTEATLVLRTRTQQAAAWDAAENTTLQHNLDDGMVARVAPDGWFAFDPVCLAGLRTVTLRVRTDAAGEVAFSLLPPAGEPLQATATAQRAGDVLTLRFDVPESASHEPGRVRFRRTAPAGTAVTDVSRVEFRQAQ